MTKVAQWVQDIVEGACGECQMKIGTIVMHPDGYKVKITGGRYWGEYGLSNFWYWRKVGKYGKLSKKEYSGYGWM